MGGGVTVSADIFDNHFLHPLKLRQTRKRRSQACKYNNFYVTTLIIHCYSYPPETTKSLYVICRIGSRVIG